MTNNDIIIGLRYILRVQDAKLVEIVESSGYLVTQNEMQSYLKREDEPGFALCPDEVFAHFLDGMVIYKRGVDKTRRPHPIELPVSNNLVLKKIRVAFKLKDTDMISLIQKSGVVKVTKAELGAFFRSRDHRNYRECGDQFLRNLLKGLA